MLTSSGNLALTAGAGHFENLVHLVQNITTAFKMKRTVNLIVPSHEESN